MKVAWNTCDKELDGKMKSVKENCLNKKLASSLVNLQNSLPLREICGKYLEKNSTAIGMVYSYIFSSIYKFAMKSKACDTPSIHLWRFD